MRTAVIFFGQTREAADNAENFLKHIIVPYDADVFISTWHPKHENDKNGNSKKIAFLDTVTELYSPTIIHSEDFDTCAYVQKVKSNGRSNKKAYDGSWAEETIIPNVHYMWYKIRQATLLKNFHEHATGIKYDTVIRLRFDLCIESFPILEPKKNEVYIPRGFDHRGGYNDLLSVSDSTVSDTLGALYGHMNWFEDRNIGFHPESMYRRYLEQKQLSVKRFDIKYKLRGVYL